MPAVVEIKNLSKSIGVLELFNDISFSIERGGKTGLIAKNGTGKTTLLNILAGDEDYDNGTIKFHPDTKLGYLSQEPQINEESDILNAVFHSQNPVLNLIKDYESALEINDTGLIEQLTIKIDNLGAWDYEIRVRQILSQLGIHNLNQKVAELSGGQKKRVALASILVENPDFLILDEPTNHLDINAISWLEEFLHRLSVTLLMVTHDRYFLDKVCNEIIEIDNLSLHIYKGNYSYFLQKRAERIELQQKEIDKAENTLRKEEDWMSRMPKARGTKAKYRIENFYELKDKASQTIRDDKVNINVAGNRIGSKILVAENVNFSWSGTKFLDDFSYTFSRFEKVGILGDNGCGKSTFLDIITGKLKPGSGKLETGETIKYGYYRQGGILFDDKMKVIDAVTGIAETITLTNGKSITAMQFLNHFLFPPSRQHDYIYKLSGGEKRRLYLCTVLMQNPNFLILDEPTNDLDIATLEVLEDYLHDFSGCVIVVSHDRYFLDEVIDHVFVFEGKGRIKDFPGNYTQYYEWKQKTEKEIPQKKPQEKKEKIKSKTEQKKLSFKEKYEFEQLENEIAMLESEKKEIETALSSGELDTDQLIEKSKKAGDLIKIIEQKTERWLELAEKAGD